MSEITTPAPGDEPDDDKIMEQMDLVLQGEGIKLCIDYTQPEIGSDEKGKRYTGERFIRDYPDRAKAVFHFLALGFSFRHIVRQVNCDIRIVRELSYRTADVNKAREMLRNIVLPTVAMSADKVQELLPDCKNLKDAAIAHGIMRDTYMQLSGLPTAKIAVDVHFDVGAELRKLNEEAREMIKKAKARVVDPPALEEGTAPA